MALVVIAMFSVPAMAQEIETGRGLLCDTKEQIERYLAIVETDGAAAVAAVNTEAQKESACAIVPVAYVRVADLSTITNKHGSYKVVAIIVIGVVTPHGVQPVQPLEQVTLFKVDDRGA